MPLHELRGLFPNLTCDQRTITSPIDKNYNCVAWVIGDKLKWWEPFGVIVPAPFSPYYWPEDVPQGDQPDTYVNLFETLGFEITENGELEIGFEKLAIYVCNGKFKHVACQLQSGIWSSKIGGQEDIQHELCDLEANHEYSYGEVQIFMKKQVQT